MTRRLPLLTEQALHAVRAEKTKKGETFRESIEDKDLDVTCRKGCSHCCRHPIMISVLEGAIIYYWLRNNGKWTSTLKLQLDNHAKTVVGLPPETWTLINIPCPLLEDDLCIAYKSRPFLCQTTYSVGLPDLCRPEQFSVRTPLVPRIEELLNFQKLEKSFYDSSESRYHVVPLSLAVLLGEQLATGKIDFSDTGSEVIKRYLEAYE